MKPAQGSIAAGLITALLLAGCLSLESIAQTSSKSARAKTNNAPETPAEAKAPESEMRAIIEYYVVDRGSLARSYPVASSPARRDRFRKFYADDVERIQKLDFESMSQEGKVDYVLFKNHPEHELRQLDIEEKQLAEIQPLIPFARTIVDLEEARRRMEPIDSARTAVTLNNLKKQVDDTRRLVEAGLRPGDNADAIHGKKTVAFRAVNAINSLRGNLRNWYTFYNGYDPVFAWWNEEPYKSLDEALNAYAIFLSERVVGVRMATTQTQGGQRPGGAGGATAGGGGVGGQGGGGFQRPGATTARPGDTSDIVGDPIGREALLSELQSEMIPYTPEELIALANKEMAWCENEMKKASRDLGYGDDWKKALEHVKNEYVEPGKQADMIRNLTLEPLPSADDHDLVTLPRLARDTRRMEMMTPARQLVSPFFLGCETILVSFPTN